LPKTLLHTIDNKRGDVLRSTFIRKAVESYMKTKKERLAIDSALVAAAASATNFGPILTVHQGSTSIHS
jgi:metal-responsive CopG/Arc/MetJ family transcriptional regulator